MQCSSCRALKTDLRKASGEAQALRSVLDQFRSDFAKAWTESDAADGNKPSRRAEALHTLYDKWVKCEAPVDTGSESLSHALQKQVLVTELKADVAHFRAGMVESNTKADAMQKLRQNRILLDENTELRRDRKLLRDELAAAQGTVSELRAALLATNAAHQRTEHAASQLADQPAASSCRLDTIMEDAPVHAGLDQSAPQAEESDGFMAGLYASLGSRVQPSRPVSGASSSTSRPLSAASHIGAGSSTAARRQTRPHSASAVSSQRSASSHVSRPMRRPQSSIERSRLHGARSGAAKGRVMHFSPVRVLNHLLGENNEKAGKLEAQLRKRDDTIASQRAQMQLLQSMVHRQILEEEADAGDDADEEMLYQQDHETSQPGQHKSAISIPSSTAQQRPERGAGQRQPRPWSASAAVRSTAHGDSEHLQRPVASARPDARSSSDVACEHAGRGLKGSRRPTSAGGVNVLDARRALQP